VAGDRLREASSTLGNNGGQLETASLSGTSSLLVYTKSASREWNSNVERTGFNFHGGYCLIKVHSGE
jgi:hypothetical protein